MEYAFDFLREGGSWMYGILALGFLCLPLCVVAGVLHGMGKRLPSLLWVGPLAAIACLGAVGTLQGSAMTRDAVA